METRFVCTLVSDDMNSLYRCDETVPNLIHVTQTRAYKTTVFSVHDVETSLPLLAGARALMAPHAGPHAAAVAAAAATVTSLPPLQPRAATTGATDLLFPLQVQCVCKYQIVLFIIGMKHEAKILCLQI
jgi:hypothetical protein